jgi:FMN phosphatase YigB (HAD superfamily)
MKQHDLIVFDLDNTLYDWYSAFLPAFYEMVEIASTTLECDREKLLDELRTVHIAHHDVEHPFGLLETDLVRERERAIGRTAVAELLDPAFHAFNKQRKENLRLFPGTRETLEEIARKGKRLVAYTDSKYHAAVGRIARLQIDDLFQRIYCREKSVTQLPPRYRAYEHAFGDKIYEIPFHRSKPDPGVLHEIISAFDIRIERAIYVGDSISRDVLMAKRAGCFAVWARYGAHTDTAMYQRLVRISHWTPDDVKKEQNYAEEAKRFAPDFVCRDSISELLKVV